MAGPVFTVAISGCSSAGKSTLAFLLGVVFEGVEVCLDDSATSNGSSAPASSISKSQKVPIIHGDEFFMPKHLCPLVTFTSAPNDTAFCQASLRHDEIGQYFISWNGTRANDKFMTYTAADAATPTTDEPPKRAGARVPSNDSVATTFSVASRLHEGGRVKTFTISGPDADCDEAVNFVRLFEALKNVARTEKVEDAGLALQRLDIGGTGLADGEVKSDTDDSDGGAPLSPTMSDNEHNGGVRLFHKTPDNQQSVAVKVPLQTQNIDDLAPRFAHHDTDVPALRAQHADLITQMRTRVQLFLKEAAHAIRKAEASPPWFAPRRPPQTLIRVSASGVASFAPKIAIIESFLLFSDPATVKPSDNNPNTARALSVFRTLQSRLHALSVELEARGGVDGDLEREREYLEGNVETINACCKKGMMEVFDVKLWLGTSRDVARRRRFGRGVYCDDGERIPGQMWKTEGYFDGVAWGNYERLNGWLLAGAENAKRGVVKGVHVRGEDWGVEETVGWAVERVLEEMGKVVGVGVRGRGRGRADGGFF